MILQGTSHLSFMVLFNVEQTHGIVLWEEEDRFFLVIVG